MEDLLFERLERLEADVAPEVVLQDLYFVDRVVRPVFGPDGPDYRVPFLVEALESRRFCSSVEDRLAAIELFDDLCELCDIRSFGALAEFLERYRRYHGSGDAVMEDR